MQGRDNQEKEAIRIEEDEEDEAEADDDSDEPVYQITDEGKAALGLPEYRLHPSFKKALKDVVIAMFGPEPEPGGDPLTIKVKVPGGEADEGTVLAVVSGSATNQGIARQQHWENDLRWRAVAKFLTELEYPCHVEEHGEAFDEDDSSQSYANIPGTMDVIAGEY